MDKIDYIEDEIKVLKKKSSKRVQVTTDPAKQIYKAAKRDHNLSIKLAKSNIKRYKLLKKQAKLVYRLTK